jgi:hypothetical protein
MKRTVYVETTIVSYLTARPSRDLIRQAQQQVTQDWWNTQSVRFDLYTSELVKLEASAGDPIAADERLVVLNALPILGTPDEAEQLAEALLAAAALPATAARDALHVGIAATNGIDFLLTWNCRHLANAELRDRIEEVCEEAGYRPPTICTPELLFEDQP